MPFYEVIFETGSHSVASYSDDAEALSALKAHQTKATNGQAGGPAGQAAERIKRVLVYDNHPADYGSTFAVPQKQLKDILSTHTGDQVDLAQLQADLWDAVDASDKNAGPHDSWFKAPEARELTWQ